MSKDRLKKCANTMVAGGSARRIAPALHYPILVSILFSISYILYINFCSLYRHMLPLVKIIGGKNVIISEHEGY